MDLVTLLCTALKLPCRGRCTHGTKTTMPDLRSQLYGWPSRQGPYYRQTKQATSAWLEALNFPKKTIRLVQEADLPLMVSNFWPMARPDRARRLVRFVVWLGLLDESIEDLGARGKKSELARLGEDLGARLKAYLRVDTGSEHTHPAIDPQDSLMVMFHHAAENISRTYDGHQRRCLYEELKSYIHSAVLEQSIIEIRCLPSYEDYVSLRKTVAGGGVLFALTEYAADAVLPRRAHDNKRFREMVNSYMLIIALTNDIFSLRKELESGQEFNAVPILLHSGRASTLDDAISIIAADIDQAVRAFNREMGELLESRPGKEDETLCGEPADILAIASVLDTLRYNCTGHLDWCERTRRYSRSGIPADGRAVLKLRTAI